MFSWYFASFSGDKVMFMDRMCDCRGWQKRGDEHDEGEKAIVEHCKHHETIESF